MYNNFSFVNFSDPLQQCVISYSSFQWFDLIYIGITFTLSLVILINLAYNLYDYKKKYPDIQSLKRQFIYIVILIISQIMLALHLMSF